MDFSEGTLGVGNAAALDAMGAVTCNVRLEARSRLVGT